MWTNIKHTPESLYEYCAQLPVLFTVFEASKIWKIQKGSANLRIIHMFANKLVKQKRLGVSNKPTVWTRDLTAKVVTFAKKSPPIKNPLKVKLKPTRYPRAVINLFNKGATLVMFEGRKYIK